MTGNPIVAVIADKLIWTEWLMVAVFVVGVVAWGFRMRKAASTLEDSGIYRLTIHGGNQSERQ